MKQIFFCWFSSLLSSKGDNISFEYAINSKTLRIKKWAIVVG